MLDKEIQIVSFNNPFPPNFGGAIDIFYKVKALSEQGVKIYLHIYHYERRDISGLKDYCEEIFLYKKDNSLIKHLSLLPFSVSSRFSSDLIENLKKKNAPIIFESIRTTNILRRESFKQTTAVRCHNIEHDYSWGLCRSEKNLFKKLAFLVDGYKLKHYERILNKVDCLLSISGFESDYFNKNFKNETFYLPVFQENERVLSEKGFGKYALYHGDLAVSDNIKSALFLIDVFKDLEEPLIIASSTEVPKVLNEIKRYDNISFEFVFKEEQLKTLIREAHINALYSFQRSGTKLKVFNALFNGRHCILNTNMVDDPDVLEVSCVVENKVEFQKAVKHLFGKKFIITNERRELLKKYSPVVNAKKLIDIML
ncbi:hypothetical protein [Seonamhaeicola maritimus]|uniref:hypothetical protein n=1 Tax=Seonamhaeicola maritimus TaxID=2591822 RepID=UPI002495079A|nr:hypothetical protein [Seonamhaeicola maritimus]